MIVSARMFDNQGWVGAPPLATRRHTTRGRGRRLGREPGAQQREQDRHTRAESEPQDEGHTPGRSMCGHGCPGILEKICVYSLFHMT